LNVHAIQTGSVAIKSCQREGVGHGSRGLLNTFIDDSWTEPLPIYAFAVEHPEGVIVLDTAGTARVTQPGYFPRWHPYFRFCIREWIEPEQEIGAQLRRLGIEPSQVIKVVLTHLHTDHAGGLHHFPDSEILVSGSELGLAIGWRGRLRGYPKNRWPSWFKPAPVELPSVAFGPFPQSLALTEAGDVTLIALPGHTPGQIGVILAEDERSILFAADSAYSQELMLKGAIDGVAPNEQVARSTLKRIQTFCRATPTVYLAAHDPQAGTRLAQRQTVRVARSA
jgi:glyoxylase-like metal-dependent hydrolase (beta-lactamase superfamily II)